MVQLVVPGLGQPVEVRDRPGLAPLDPPVPVDAGLGVQAGFGGPVVPAAARRPHLHHQEDVGRLHPHGVTRGARPQHGDVRDDITGRHPQPDLPDHPPAGRARRPERGWAIGSTSRRKPGVGHAARGTRRGHRIRRREGGHRTGGSAGRPTHPPGGHRRSGPRRGGVPGPGPQRPHHPVAALGDQPAQRGGVPVCGQPGVGRPRPSPR